MTADELALTIDGLIGDDSERLTGAAGLSTVPSVLHEVRVMLEQYWPSVPHVLIEPGVRTGIPLLVDNPKEVGADRIVNCLAAYPQVRQGRDRRRLRIVDLRRRRVGQGRVPRRCDRTGCAGVLRCGGGTVGGSAARRADPAAVGHRQEHRGMHAGRCGVRIRRAGRRAGVADPRDVDGFAGDDVAVVATGHTAPLVLPDLRTVARTTTAI